MTIANPHKGTRLNSQAILMVGTAMGVMLFLGYLVVFFCHMKAVIKHDIMWPGKDEDAH